MATGFISLVFTIIVSLQGKAETRTLRSVTLSSFSDILNFAGYTQCQR